MLHALAAIAAGASLGAIVRWGLANAFNALLPTLPPGTLIANLLGGYLVGVAVAFFAQHPALPPAWRLFVITGFLGGLTTFSTFSAEVVANLSAGRTGWALATAALHLAGSVLMTLLGMASVALLRAAPPPA
ncbi:fluoride efflux transporter CrcB [Aquabacterium sp. OR-4]|uniref:fluoride efflux transporter CrcB n=1 Tax=Aquabacterium sp. OR-4 TaxID=2978127 RepID=UPI0021B3842F|nr:fluoride efflux transporter CrcB [Aquabacterium sp. OR-4]MDT7834919.1 fluoride efflux transporter CrcB [Aquabacterium sp. OR-4]